jgi:hypothetical protein
VHIYQLPGGKNPEGHLRFNFPNKFSVEQYDTPDKYSFSSDVRALDACDIHVQFPEKYAEVLLAVARPRDAYSTAQIQSLYGPDEREISFKEFIPVHLTYQTAFVDDAGKLQIRSDLYDLDKRLLTLTRNDARDVADIPVKLHSGGQDCGRDPAMDATAVKQAEANGAQFAQPQFTQPNGQNDSRDRASGFFERLLGGFPESRP